MAVSDADIAFAKELLAGVGLLSTRKMMGGLCLYCDGAIFALLTSDGQLFLKAQGAFIDRMKALGSEQWTYQREGKKPVAMPYWTLPDAYLDDPDAAAGLARDALTYL